MKLIIAGRGCLTAVPELRAYVKRTGTPVVCSLPAVGAIPSDWPEYLGMLGHTGTEKANSAVANADYIIALGARLDIRQVGTEQWEGKTLIVVDYDAEELANKRVRGDVHVSDPSSVIDWLNIQP